MDIKDVLGYTPAFLVPSAWILTMFNATGVIGSHSLFIAHLVMVTFLTVFVYVGWDLMDEGVMKAWRTVILLGIPFTSLGLAGFLLDISSNLSYIPDIIYWASVPSLTAIYTGLEAEKVNIKLVGGGLAATAGMILTVFWIFGSLNTPRIGFVLLASGQLLTLIEAVRLDN